VTDAEDRQPSPPDDQGPSLGRSRAKDWAINIGLMLGAIAAYLLVAELVLRAGEGDDPSAHEDTSGPYAGIYGPSSDPLLEYVLKPGVGVVNSKGYIGPVVDPGKPADVLRVVGLGDSITMYQTAEGTNYLTLLGKELKPSKAARVEVLNFAVGGYDTAQEVRVLQTRGLAYAPDVVVMGYCLNDAFNEMFLFNEVTGKITLGDRDRKEVAEVQRMTSDGEQRGLRIVDFFSRKVKTASASLTPDEFYATVFESPDWKEGMQALRRLGELSRQKGFDAVVVLFPFLLDFESYLFGPLHKRITEEASKAGLGVIDLFESYRALGTRAVRVTNEDGSLHVDYVHPTPKGHRVAADKLINWFVEAGHASR